MLTAAAELRREPNFVMNVLDKFKKRVSSFGEGQEESSTDGLSQEGITSGSNSLLFVSCS